MAHHPNDALEILKQEARDEVDEVARQLKTALIHMQSAFRGKKKPQYSEYQWRALHMASKALDAATAAGIDQEG